MSNLQGYGTQSYPTPPVAIPNAENINEVIKHLYQLAEAVRTSSRILADSLGYREPATQSANSAPPQPVSGTIDQLREIRTILNYADVSLGNARSVQGV